MEVTMESDIYYVSSIGQGRLYVMTKPFSVKLINDEFDAIKAFGISRVVSLLKGSETYGAGSIDEIKHCRNRGIVFIQYAAFDRCIPTSSDKFLALVQFLYDELLEGRKTVVYCKAGIGRTGVVATAVLVKYGLTSDHAIKLVSEARRVSAF
jgi:protein-tyrosine phosphatase